MKCHYCSEKAIGINYRPRAELENKAVCKDHQSSLFIPFRNTNNFDKGKFMQITVDSDYDRENNVECQGEARKMNKREIENQQFFEELMNCVIGEFNLIKAEVRACEDKMKALDQEDSQYFSIGCKITNPYMLLREDKDMLLNTLLSRIKHRKSSKKQKSIAVQNLRTSEYIDSRPSSEIKNILSPMMKNSNLTMPDSCKNTRNLFDSESKYSGFTDENQKKDKFFRKNDLVKQ